MTDRDGNVTTYANDGAARLQTVQQKPDPLNQPNLVYVTAITRDGNGNAAVTPPIAGDWGIAASGSAT